jgi:hypothetical protein
MREQGEVVGNELGASECARLLEDELWLPRAFATVSASRCRASPLQLRSGVHSLAPVSGSRHPSSRLRG